MQFQNPAPLASATGRQERECRAISGTRLSLDHYIEQFFKTLASDVARMPKLGGPLRITEGAGYADARARHLYLVKKNGGRVSNLTGVTASRGVPPFQPCEVARAVVLNELPSGID